MKYYASFIASTIFGLLLLSVYYIHICYFSVDVVFYSALNDGLIAVAISAITLYVIPFFKRLENFEKFQLALIWLLSSYAFAISVPTVIDRSLSFYILEKLQQRGGNIKQESFHDIFTNEYVKEHRLVDVRLTEQLESGTITINNGCVSLTDKGNNIASFSRYFRQHFLPKRRLLMGQYSDDLVDPFSQSRANNLNYDYKCE